MFFKVQSFPDMLWMLIWNITVIGVLHVVLLYCCTRLSKETLDFQRPRFAPKRWEHEGRFYRDKLKINVWKDYIPQYVTKDGFSKESLEKNPSLSYVEAFLAETCRGEWYHAGNLIGIVFFLAVNPLLYGLLFSLALTVIHGTCIAIQRYNRFRLLILRKKLLRDARRAGRSVEPIVVTAVESEEIA